MEREMPGASRAADTSARSWVGRRSAEEIVWLGLWAAALALIACVLWIAPPLSDLYPSPTYEFYPPFLTAVKPEPLEATRVLFALLTPFALAGLALLGTGAPARRRFDPVAIAFQLAALGLVVWGVLEQEDGPFPFIDPDYFRPLLLSVPVLIGGVVIGGALTALVVSRRLPVGLVERMKRATKGARRFALAAAVLLTGLWLTPAVLTDGLLAGSGLIPSGHVLVQGEDYFAVANGLTPMVDYVSQYANLLPLAVAPVLTAFDLSTTSFSLLMTVLSGAALLAIYGVFREVTLRPWPALALYVPFLALALFPWTDHGLSREFNGNYFGVLPGRYFGPFIVAWLCAVSIRRGRLPAWLLCFAAGLTALNNAEFGIPCVIALLGAVFLASDRTATVGARVRPVLVQAAIGFAAAAALVCLVVLIRSGALPDLGLLTYYTGVFARQGFGLEPMPTLGLHIAVYMTYAAALLVAAVRYASSHADRTTTAMLAYAGVFGLLTSEYFAGRSLPWQLMLLFPVWGLTLALLAWVTALHLRSRGAHAPSLRRTIIPSVAVMIAFGVMVAAIVTVPLPWRQVERLADDGEPSAESQLAQGFVERESTPGERVVLLGTAADHRIAEHAGVANVSPWNDLISVVSDRELDRAVAALDSSDGTKLFLYQGSFLHRSLRERGFEKVAGEQPMELWERTSG